MKPMRPVMVRMSDTMHAELEGVAQCHDRSVAWVVRRAVSEYLRRVRVSHAVPRDVDA